MDFIEMYSRMIQKLNLNGLKQQRELFERQIEDISARPTEIKILMMINDRINELFTNKIKGHGS